ncbi:hypothetical protein F5Y06DRAFT_294000 [Hypoxylon sp. FL0890]|nr:hypothetical protein F5Y06DRAFT_294000 [Hypoxylon sp. FL0890]
MPNIKGGPTHHCPGDETRIKGNCRRGIAPNGAVYCKVHQNICHLHLGQSKLTNELCLECRTKVIAEERVEAKAHSQLRDQQVAELLQKRKETAERKQREARKKAANKQKPLPTSTLSSHKTTPIPKKQSLDSSIQSIHDIAPQENYEGSTESEDNDDSLFELDEDERLTKKWLDKAFTLCENLWPTAKPDTLRVCFLASGSFNAVFSVSMMIADGEPVEYVLRIPELKSTVIRTVAILEYVTKFTDLNVPEVIAWDATKNNPLRHSYIILSRIPGKCLQDVWEDLSHDQKLILAKELARLYLQFESATNPVAGAIEVQAGDFCHGDELTNQVFVEPFGAETMEIPHNPIDRSNDKSDILPLDRLRHDPPGSSVNDIMLSIFKRRLYHCENRKTPDTFKPPRYFNPCQKIIEGMVNLGVFEAQDDTICLHHPDLFPRNIMVDFSPNITITGVLDWDDALFVPRFASRVPPRWLWRSELENEYEYGEPLDPKDNAPDTPENAEIKVVFENAVGQDWMLEASDKWFPLARALLRFSRQILFHHSAVIVHLAALKNRWKSLSTDAVENLYFWRDRWESLLADDPGCSEQGHMALSIGHVNGDTILNNSRSEKGSYQFRG